MPFFLKQPLLKTPIASRGFSSLFFSSYSTNKLSFASNSWCLGLDILGGLLFRCLLSSSRLKQTHKRHIKVLQYRLLCLTHVDKKKQFFKNVLSRRVTRPDLSGVPLNSINSTCSYSNIQALIITSTRALPQNLTNNNHSTGLTLSTRPHNSLMLRSLNHLDTKLCLTHLHFMQLTHVKFYFKRFSEINRCNTSFKWIANR